MGSTPSTCTFTTTPNQNENVLLVILLVRLDVGGKVYITVKSFPKSIAVLNVMKGDVMDMNHVNVAIFPVPGDAEVQRKVTVW